MSLWHNRPLTNSLELCCCTHVDCTVQFTITNPYLLQCITVGGDTGGRLIFGCKTHVLDRQSSFKNRCAGCVQQRRVKNSVISFECHIMLEC